MNVIVGFQDMMDIVKIRLQDLLNDVSYIQVISNNKKNKKGFQGDALHPSNIATKNRKLRMLLQQRRHNNF